MNSLIKSYGKGLTAVFVGLTIGWILLLIVLPQIRMLDRAFTYEDRGGDAATLALEINRAYTRLFTIDQRIGDLNAALQSGAENQTTSTSPSAPSFGPPGMTTPTPVAPSVPSMASPFAPSASIGGAQDFGSAQDIQKEMDELSSEKASLKSQIEQWEKEEAESKSSAGSNESYSLRNFTDMSVIHLTIFASTILYALCVTILAFVVCYPVAYAVATTRSANRVAILMLALVIPYAINELLRIFAWVMILEKQGVLNGLLDLLGVIDMGAGEGVRFAASNGAVFAVMVYAYVLFMVFPIYNTIETLDKNQIEAAKDLGASIWRVHWRVVLPHAKPGIAVGAIMTFMLSAGSIAVPEIVGRGLHPDWFSQVIYRRFFEADSWNQGAAYSVALLAACIVFILINMAVFRVGVKDIAK